MSLVSLQQEFLPSPSRICSEYNRIRILDLFSQGGRGSLKSRLQGWKVSGSKPNSPEDTPCMWAGLLHVKSNIGAKRPPADVLWKFGEGMPDQVSFSSSDSGLKL
ncbi:hypothetical protein AVEN_84788-1 [Araneus ventricosus]|uniref:Uncharacterized protein n=1 Tax=Araneus ventricosus TaxID=182803 RepID=A0A4Y2DJW6_ARAVE|nr:hypothetical protein AVEN_13205-1 [Araneus ventricosus]GBM17110.1 hypothetical protein AVEN_84788-1 [Araneus ventricosus]